MYDCEPSQRIMYESLPPALCFPWSFIVNWTQGTIGSTLSRLPRSMSIRKTKATAVSLLNLLKLLYSFSIDRYEHGIQRQRDDIAYTNLNRSVLPNRPVREKRLHNLYKALRT
jgi:hypothetical protein